MTANDGKEKQKKGKSERSRAIQPKIMTLPLPQILDELEGYIRRVEEAVKQAQDAARESREAAMQAQVSGEKAAEAARNAADAAVAKVQEESANAIKALDIRVSGVESGLKELEEKVRREAKALDTAFLALKERHIEDSPFLDK